METTYNYQVLPTGGMAAAPNPGGGALTGLGAGAWTGITPLVFNNGTKIVMVWCHDNRLVIRFSYDGTNYGDAVVLYDAAQAEVFYTSVQAVQVINYQPGSFAVYQIMGQW